MKLVKSLRRGKMANSTLDDVMVVKLQSPHIEVFEPKEAIERWMVSWLYTVQRSDIIIILSNQ